MMIFKLLVIIFLSNLLFYIFFIPSAVPLKPSRFDRYFGLLLYTAAYGFSVLRLPFAVIPYISKLIAYTLYRKLPWESYPFQALRIIGDFISFALTSLLLTSIPLGWICITAEVIRLCSEKGQMIFSAVWQQFPHRDFAKWLTRRRIYCDYTAYYALTDAERMRYVLLTLKSRASHNPTLSDQLSYVNGFHVVPLSHDLRCNHVRDIAHGLIFIHQSWTNDPWLLIGQAIRRSPWLFDPRYLNRPFYYRSQSNRLATLAVLCNAQQSPPYTWYQVGHEIKVARYDLFFRLMRRLDINLEAYVGEDGTYLFNPTIKKVLGEDCRQRPLWTDQEVIDHMENQQPIPLPVEIAERYAYPLKYVNEILLTRIKQRLRPVPCAVEIPNGDNAQCYPNEHNSYQAEA